MTKSEPSSDLQQSAGMVGGLVKQARLVWRLLKDNRVPGWVKLIPVAGLIYLISPIDLLPDLMLPGLGEVDDVMIILLALKGFVDLSPPGVVREHLENLLGRRGQAPMAGEPEPYIDASYRVLDRDEE
jgi:uncharacterized membrane protein YkvA (DUF1232 family)